MGIIILTILFLILIPFIILTVVPSTSCIIYSNTVSGYCMACALGRGLKQNGKGYLLVDRKEFKNIEKEVERKTIKPKNGDLRKISTHYTNIRNKCHLHPQVLNSGCDRLDNHSFCLEKNIQLLQQGIHRFQHFYNVEIIELSNDNNNFSYSPSTCSLILNPNEKRINGVKLFIYDENEAEFVSNNLTPLYNDDSVEKVKLNSIENSLKFVVQENFNNEEEKKQIYKFENEEEGKKKLIKKKKKS